MTTPLALLDLSPFGEGQTPADGLRASIALAQHAERLGYARYWVAEHHLNPGVAGSAPHVLLAAIAAATSRIRVGTAATIIGNYSALQVVEAAGVVAALHPGRFDLGIGRSGATSSAQTPPPSQPEDRVVDGLLLPASRPFAFDAARFTAQARLLGRTLGDADRFEQDVRDILALIDGTYVAPEGVPIHATPADVLTLRGGGVDRNAFGGDVGAVDEGEDVVDVLLEAVGVARRPAEEAGLRDETRGVEGERARRGQEKPIDDALVTLRRERRTGGRAL